MQIEHELVDRVTALEEQNEELREKVRECEEGHAEYYRITESLTDERDAAVRDGEEREEELVDAIEDALEDLKALADVPLKDLETAIEAVRAQLKEVL